MWATTGSGRASSVEAGINRGWRVSSFALARAHRDGQARSCRLQSRNGGARKNGGTGTGSCLSAAMRFAPLHARTAPEIVQQHGCVRRPGCSPAAQSMLCRFALKLYAGEDIPKEWTGSEMINRPATPEVLGWDPGSFPLARKDSRCVRGGVGRGGQPNSKPFALRSRDHQCG